MESVKMRGIFLKALMVIWVNGTVTRCGSTRPMAAGVLRPSQLLEHDEILS